MLTLYNYFRSSASFRVRIALELKGLTYHAIPVHLVNNGGEQYQAEYAALNPQCMVPTLSDNENVITQSLAIIEYLDEKFKTPPLLPTDLYLKAISRSIALMISADLHPLNNLRVLNYLTYTLKISDTQKDEWYQHWIATGLTALETKIATGNFSGNYCVGDSPSLADLCLVPQMYNARRFNCDVSAYPNLVRIDQHCQAQSAFKKASPEFTEMV